MVAQALVFAIGAVTRIFMLADHFTVRCGRRGYLPLAVVADVTGKRYYLPLAVNASVVLSDKSDKSDGSDITTVKQNPRSCLTRI